MPYRRILGCILALWSLGSAAEAADDFATQKVPSAHELEVAGAVIGEIVIDAQNIFDLTDPRESSGLYRLADTLHVPTRKHVIRDQLLFKPGDPYRQRSLEESERILRSARYLYDASVKPVGWHDGRVDILVTTRDVWTLNPGIAFGRHGGKNSFGFELEELNIMGTGTAISAAHKSGVDRDSDIIEFEDRHLGGSWVSLATAYANNSDGSTQALALERPFYSLSTPWAAGLKALDDDHIGSLYDRGEIIDQFRKRARTATVFGGRSPGLVNGWTTRWTVGATYDEAQFSAAPDWSGPGLLPEDRRLIYPWIGFELVQNDFEKHENRDQIGRTEDFHLGTHLRAQVGWAGTAFGSDRDALMFDAAADYGLKPDEVSMLLLNATASGRFEYGSLANARLDAGARYYREQSPRRLFFATVVATATHELDLDDQILLGGDNGLRGYPLRYQAGTARALMTLEQRYFTDWYPFRLFRLGGAVFCDVGRTWGQSEPAGPSLGILKDVGVGLRIGNSRSGLGNIIHIDVAMPLDGDSSISNVQFLVETRQRF